MREYFLKNSFTEPEFRKANSFEVLRWLVTLSPKRRMAIE